MFLNPQDVRDLTGLVRPSAQIRWLTANGWHYAVDVHGQPRVAQAEFNRHLVGGPQDPEEFELDLSTVGRRG